MNHFHFGAPPAAAAADRPVRVPENLETKEQLFRALCAAVPLPDYFGNNWDALEECLGDLAWIPQGKVLLIHDDIPLRHAPADRKTYLSILAAVAGKSDRLLVIFPTDSRAEIQKILTAKT